MMLDLHFWVEKRDGIQFICMECLSPFEAIDEVCSLVQNMSENGVQVMTDCKNKMMLYMEYIQRTYTHSKLTG